MKNAQLILLTLLLTLSITAQEISTNTTQGKYSKPGAPIDMTYSSQKVDVNETSDVNITLTTAIKHGDVAISITLDKNLSSTKEFEKNITYKIEPNQQNHLIQLQVKSEQAGLYYIKLLTKVDKGYGIKLRSFAVPIYIGQTDKVIKKNMEEKQMKALSSGENISISKAIETIKLVNENNSVLK